MAINTARRRYTMLNYDDVGASQITFIPDGSIGELSIYHLLGLYGGITLDAPVAVSLIEKWWMEASQPIFVRTKVIGY